MNFLEAMIKARSGERVMRESWASNNGHTFYKNGDLLWASLDHPEQHYHPMCNDIFAEDWSSM